MNLVKRNTAGLCGIKKLFMLLFTVALFSTAATAKELYVAQNSTGGGTGSDCSNAHPVSWFNSSSNWGSANGQISAGDTVHACGTFNGAAGSTAFTFQGSGGSGSPITLLLETGAVLTSPYWSSNGAIDTNNKTWLVIDGGSNGLIQNTANGTNLGNHQTSMGVRAGNCNNCVVKNLTIANMYVHSSASDTSIDQTNTNCIMAWPVNTFTADHNVCHDMGWALNINGNNVTISNNDAYNIDHGIAWGPGGASTNTLIFGNHFHDYANWDTSSNTYHHDGIHMWGQTGGSVTNCKIYNNKFDGNP